jgi:hypothetical protein
MLKHPSMHKHKRILSCIANKYFSQQCLIRDLISTYAKINIPKRTQAENFADRISCVNSSYILLCNSVNHKGMS